jgi:signal peptidase II
MVRLRRAVWLLPAAAAAALDLWSKGIWSYLPQYDATKKTVIDGFLYITAVWNTGGAWSTKFPPWLLLAGTALAVPAIALWIFWPARASAWDSLAKALVLGGAVGNLVDRVIWGKVRDWIDVELFGWHYPTFNVADAALVVGIGILLVGSFRHKPAEQA